jgi:hypothetical protein
MKLKASAKNSKFDVQQSDRLVATSPTFLKLADSILAGLDRRTIGELVAGYFYFKSTGRTDADFANFLMTNRLDVILRMIGNSLPVLLPALFSDKEFRSLIIDFMIRSVTNFERKK